MPPMLTSHSYIFMQRSLSVLHGFNPNGAPFASSGNRHLNLHTSGSTIQAHKRSNIATQGLALQD